MTTDFPRRLLLAALVAFAFPGAGTLRAQGVTFSISNYNTGSGPFSLVLADVLGTGRPAIITGNQNDNSFRVLGNFGHATAFHTNLVLGLNISPRALVGADIDGNGTVDLIAIGPTSTEVLTNTSYSSFGTGSFLSPGGNCGLAVDLNHSGKPALLLGAATNVVVCTNGGGGHFGAVSNLSVSGPVYSMAAADLNADGWSDLVVANYNAGTLTVFTNDGTGLLISNATYAAGALVRMVVTADMNGDGHPDVVAANGAALTILTNNGTGALGLSSTIAVAAGCYSVVAADFNGDGRTDLITIDGSARPGVLTVLTNTGSGFGPPLTLTAGQESQAIAVADLNGDSKPDLVLGNTGNTVTVLLNSTPFPAPPLNLVTAGGQSVLYWASPAPDAVLQATTSLSHPDWFTVTNGHPIQGVTLPRTSPALFFRLGLR